MGWIFDKRRLGGLVLVALLAAACGPLPRPFQPAPETSSNPLVREAATSGIWIQPIDGATGPMSKLLGAALAENFKNQNIPAVTAAGANSRYRLKGKAAINRDDPSLPYVVLIHWTLYDFGGQAIGQETQGVPGTRQDWDLGSPKIIAAVGEEGSEIIAALIDRDDETLKPVKPRLAGLWVSPIESAPGDGNMSLTRAIKTAIKGAGIAVAQERRHAEFILEGRFRLDAAKENLKKVQITWVVLTADGREIGRATQKNLVEAGTFQGPWGEVATLVADAALEGIQGVLQAAGASRYRLGPPARVLKTEVPAATGPDTLPPPWLQPDVPPAGAKTP
jgi:hypothetical protein